MHSPPMHALSHIPTYGTLPRAPLVPITHVVMYYHTYDTLITCYTLITCDTCAGKYIDYALTLTHMCPLGSLVMLSPTHAHVFTVRACTITPSHVRYHTHTCAITRSHMRCHTHSPMLIMPSYTYTPPHRYPGRWRQAQLPDKLPRAFQGK